MTVIKDTFTNELGLIKNKGIISFFDEDGEEYDMAFYTKLSAKRYEVLTEVKSMKEFLELVKLNEAKA